MRRKFLGAVTVTLLSAWGFPGICGRAEEPVKPAGEQTSTAVIKPKLIAEQTKKGLAYLVSQQQANGGWGQGGGWRTASEGGRVEGGQVQDPPDVGNTAIAALALIRAGHTPKEGEYAKNVAKAIEFIAAKIDKVEKDSPYVTDVLGTQLQSKIGQYVDTFLAALVLSELKGKMPDEISEKRLTTALDRTLAKIEKHQKADGTFAGNAGWASVLSQALCSKAINRAAQNGANVKLEVLERDSRLAANAVDVKSRDFSATAAEPAASRLASIGRVVDGPSVAGAPSDAGVSIYKFSAAAGGLQDAVNTNRPAAQRAERVLADNKASKEAKDEAQATLTRARTLEEASGAATNGILKRLDDKQFIAGFGNNGGEEFLSYMNISETLLAKGGKEWQSWDKSICENVHRVQNEDGSWSGHHCITGRTFCTSAALLTLMADRAPVPLAAKIHEGK
ncbi:MAG TPA: prenyltransferase/squalene oxidase repeat-containing protein [Pirellulaceae bacterium]|nr:prenyltransferase/squalene oxidase repeat-containing protein [Pirellulaceae bacterium]